MSHENADHFINCSWKLFHKDFNFKKILFMHFIELFPLRPGGSTAKGSLDQKKEAVTTANPNFNIFNYTRLFDSADKKSLGLKWLYTLHSLHFQHILFLNPECLQLTHFNSSDAERRKQDLIDATLSTRTVVKVEALLLQETSRKKRKWGNLWRIFKWVNSEQLQPWLSGSGQAGRA